jgi:hypothetical protein
MQATSVVFGFSGLTYYCHFVVTVNFLYYDMIVEITDRVILLSDTELLTTLC